MAESDWGRVEFRVDEVMKALLDGTTEFDGGEINILPERFKEEYGMTTEQLETLIERIVPMAMRGQAPLDRRLVRGLACDGEFFAKQVKG